MDLDRDAAPRPVRPTAPGRAEPGEGGPAFEHAVERPATRGQDGQEGKIGWILAWLVGIPLPVLLVVYLFSRAC